MSDVAIIGSMIGRRLLQRRVVRVLVVLAMAPAIVLLLRSDSNDPAVFHIWMLFLFFALGLPLISLITATAALGDERQNHTLPYLLTKPVSRFAIASAGWLAATAAALMIVTIGVGSAWAVTGIESGEAGIGWPALAGAAVATLGYAAVFVPLGLLARQATLIGLAFVLIWEGVIAAAGDTLATASLWRTGLSAYVDLAGEVPAELTDALGNILPGAGGALAKMLVLVALSLGFTTLILRRQDLVKE